jgi:NADH:ubiquinone oxidoreductase subunit 6 (subunit J)
VGEPLKRGVGLLRRSHVNMNNIKRPPAVWLTQSLLVLFALLFLSVFLLNVVNLLRNPGAEFSVIATIIGYSVMVGMVLLLVSAFLGLARRKIYGKWLGLLSLILIWALLLFMQLRPPSGLYKRFEYDNSAQVAGAAISQILLHGLFLILILRLSFAKKISEFFRNEVERN